MGITNIEWVATRHSDGSFSPGYSFNPWRGCTKVSAGCANYYADELSKRNPATLGIWGDNGTRVLAADTMLSEPLKWNREAEKSGSRPRVFCASLCDVFEDWKGPIVNTKGQRLYWSHSREPHESKWHWIPANDIAGNESQVIMDDVRLRLFELIDQTPNLDWLLLTKRPENIRKMWYSPKAFGILSMYYGPDGFDGSGSQPEKMLRRSNVWLGTTVENQEQANKRIPELLKCRDLSPVLFVSCEPLLGPVDFRQVPGMNRIDRSGVVDWVIVGGESGPNARPMHPQWARQLRDQCQAAGVAMHFKQWGEFGPAETATPKQVENAVYHVCEHGERLFRVGKKQAGRLLDGIEHNDFPKAGNR